MAKWNSTKLADFIRGEAKPYALQLGEWGDYYNDLRKRKPIRYWITEILFVKIQNIICWPFRFFTSIRYYIRNRWIYQTHLIKTGLSPGNYYDLDHRILFGVFTELVDFVEIELAHLSLFNYTTQYTFKNRRCVQAAYDYFEWTNSLTEEWDLPLKQNMQTVKELYEWWTIDRPLRQDTSSINSLSHGPKYFKLISTLENKYYQEDTDKLVILIKIRQHLWS